MTNTPKKPFNRPTPEWMDAEWHHRMADYARQSGLYGNTPPKDVEPASGHPNYDDFYHRTYIEPMQQREAEIEAIASNTPGVTISTDYPGQSEAVQPVHAAVIPDRQGGGLRVRLFFRRGGDIRYIDTDLPRFDDFEPCEFDFADISEPVVRVASSGATRL